MSVHKAIAPSGHNIHRPRNAKPSESLYSQRLSNSPAFPNTMLSAAFVRPGFAAISHDDHAGYLWIVTILGTLYTFVVAIVRFYIKFQILGLDDYLLGLATIFHSAQSGAVFVSLSKGLGRSNDPRDEADLSQAGQSLLTSKILAILSLCLAKCSVAAILIRVLAFSSEKRRYICWGLVATNVLWAFGSMAGFVSRCDAAELLTIDANVSCPRQFLRWQIITAVDIITETLNCCLPWTLVWDLNMTHKVKFQIIVAFSFRLPLLALSAVHLHSFAGYVDSPIPRLAITESLFWLQIIITWSLVSATIPNLRQLIMSFNTRFGMKTTRDGRQGEQTENTYPLVTIGGSSKASGPPGHGQVRTRESGGASQAAAAETDEETGCHRREPSLRPDSVLHVFAIQRSESAGSESRAGEEHPVSRTGSRELIIKKEVQWEVRHEDPPQGT